ncbi:hypothetical protein TREMEDRAFT_24947 [Tremella mesenterica DSM 1558]|uniref:uncharacterized protein n=1 Tax=Tremella mesenterica (strain ATCC 24925 / CBS 8224 / DSM 1558 / NBRC 9311 / NRRL Y-6157 / RJB 2259-6 / UBC 559-6) TaxID=578456 RepID=UPI0003F48D44|nr:uncharacterized protein TREMEDRAFT_24947 [Tremella mesenterica DSM 1558]EIW73125.1 hypothetical protein TREMEDRAFT_24947 [Tremella mesenterica DSM 1558]
MKIEARNLSYTYPGASTPTLKNINLFVLPGETLAIVGFNGGGKTTLIKALLGLYDHAGELYINDRPIQEFDPRSLHDRMSCLFQDFCKYSLTLCENVGVGDINEINEREHIMQAVRKGGADQVAYKLGLERNLISYEGRNLPATALSGGHWQRIASSRAFLRADRADLIVFDEPSSALDPKADSDLFQRIHNLSHPGSAGRPTMIYISHRFSTVKKADKIAVVENGTIIELGSHDELIVRRGRYEELFRLQKEGFD